MRLWLLELQKIFAPRSVIISLALFILCFMVWLFTPIARDRTEDYYYQLPMQMIEYYGRTMEPADIADFESKFQAAENEMMDYAAQLGLGEFSLDEILGREVFFDVYSNGELIPSPYSKEIQNAADEFYASEPYIEWIIMLTYEQWFHKEPYPPGQPYTTDVVNQNMVDFYDRWFPDLILIVALSVLLLVSPFLAADNMQNVMPLQFSSAVGRRIRRTQLAAISAAAIAFTTLLALFAVGWLFLRTQPYAFFGSSVNSFFLMNRRIFEMTFGQLILAYIAQMYLLSLGAALAAFIASRFSKNLMSLVIKMVPIGALLILLQTYAMTGGTLYAKIEPNSSAFREGLGLWGIAANAAWLALAAALSTWIVHRDRRIDLT